MDSENAQITELLRAAKSGDGRAEEQLYKVLLVELRRVAAARLRRERSGHTLQPTALVNEAYLRLSAQKGRTYENRAHFMAAAAGVMQHILVDYARARRAGKRFGALRQVELTPNITEASTSWSDDILALDAELSKLAVFDPRSARVVQLKVFAGMTDDEVAEAVGIGKRTVKRDFKAAKAWLASSLRPPSSGESLTAGGEGYQCDS